jgi:hypothetical protein
MSSKQEIVDGVRGLETAIKAVASSMMNIENFPANRVLAGTAVFGQMQLMILHAQAIEASATTEHAITASAQLRPMVLAWCRMMALFREPDPNAAAIMSLRQGCVDRLEHLRTVEPDAAEVGRLEDALNVLRTVAMAAGSGRGERGTRAPGRGGDDGMIDDARDWLRLTPHVLVEFDDALAESDHLGPTPMMISESDGVERILYLAFSDQAAEAANRTCFHASRVLMRAWEQITRTFGIAEAPIET